MLYFHLGTICFTSYPNYLQIYFLISSLFHNALDSSTHYSDQQRIVYCVVFDLNLLLATKQYLPNVRKCNSQRIMNLVIVWWDLKLNPLKGNIGIKFYLSQWAIKSIPLLDLGITVHRNNF